MLCRVVTALRYTKWIIDNFCPKEIFDDIADRPDPSTARLRNSESGDEPAQSQQSRDEILMKLKVTMARIVAFDAFRNAVPHLDLMLTPNVFGIVNNSNIAPASKERVERLINSLLDNCENEIESLLSLLPKETRWTSSDQGRFLHPPCFRISMSPHDNPRCRVADGSSISRFVRHCRSLRISLPGNTCQGLSSKYSVKRCRQELTAHRCTYMPATLSGP